MVRRQDKYHFLPGQWLIFQLGVGLRLVENGKFDLGIQQQFLLNAG